MEQAASIELSVSDVSGQRMFRASDVAPTGTIADLIDGLTARMGLVRHDVEGRPLRYYARLEREGRHLNGAEVIGEALTEGDHLVLTPNIDAGGGR